MQTVALITNDPQCSSTELARIVAAHGLRFMPIVCTKVEPFAVDAKMNNALQALARYDWIVFTSKRAVAVFFDRLAEQHIMFPDTLKIAAVGPVTAASLQERNVKVDIVPQEFSAIHLARSFKDDIAGKRVLFPRSARAVDTAAEELKRNGARVDVIEIYTIVFKPLSSEEYRVFKNGEIAYILFLSSSALHALVSTLGDDAFALLSPTTAICIGPQTASTAKEIPFQRVVTAQNATFGGVVDALVQEL